jgi:glycosyltransferase involved in cell wall biosynthesis
MPQHDATTSPRFVVACRLVREKGVHVLLEARRRATAPWILQVAGDGPERESLATAARTLGAAVEMLGQLRPDELATTMQRATAVLLPSIWYETFGLTAIEAFSLGRPVVASAIGALNEVVDDTSGLRIAAGDATAWAAALDRLARDPALAAQLGQGARNRYLAHFTPARDAERLLAVYRSVVRR